MADSIRGAVDARRPALAGLGLVLVIAALAAATARDRPAPPPTAPTALPASERNAFAKPVAGLPFERRLGFNVGQALFERLWVAAPASTRSADGLGPLFNARSCQGCHVRNGRGQPPQDGDEAGRIVSLVARLSIPPQNHADREALAAHRVSAIAEPTYGTQLQSLGTAGQTVEGRLQVDYEAVEVMLGDGTRVELRRPHYRISAPGFGALHADAMLSPRLAPPVVGMGLLARIPELAILAGADPADSDGDGISGRANLVWSSEHSAPMLGRFGWKAGEPTLRQQATQALALDIGISSVPAPDGHGDCTARQHDCRAAPTGNSAEYGNVEAPDAVIDALLFYLDNVAAPAPRDESDPSPRRGERLFAEAGCAACHRPSFVTATDPAQPWLSGRQIRPYSDLLLHDMGAALADHRPEGVADGREWRTPPLWGLGRTADVNGHSNYLHDGRARDLAEAILWHGGEAAPAQQRFATMSKRERDDLLRFLEGL